MSSCAYCGLEFKNTQEHLSHLTVAHDIGYVPRGQRNIIRPLSCWRCAKDIYRNDAGLYTCTCGFTVPNKKVDE